MKNDLAPFRRLLVLTAALAIVALGSLPGSAMAAPLSAGPTSITFTKETVGKTGAPQVVTVSNLAPGAAQVVGVSVVGADPGDFAIGGDGCGGAIVNEGQTCAVEVAFAPVAGGLRTAVLEVAVEGEASILVPLEGTGQTMRLDVPGTASFPTTSIGGASTEKVALKNLSETGVNASEVKVEGADAGDFGIEGANCVGVISPGMGCELTVRFSPAATGPREATLRVSTDGTPSAYLVQLNGAGVAPELAFEPGQYDFGLVETHSGGPRANFALRNVGVATVQLANLEITGPGASEFWIPNSNCWGSALPPGSTCGVEVQFNANQEGSYSAALSVQAGGVTFQAPLSARAESPKVEASPAPLAFAPTTVGSRQVQEVTLTNTGHLPVAFFIALVSGGDVGSFHLLGENCTSNVFAGTPRIFEPGESCVAKVAFEPSAVGAKAATVSFFGGGEGALQVAVRGDAVAPQLGLTPSSRDFGGVAVGTAGPTQTFQLRNETATPQAIDSASLTGPDPGEFSIRSDECTEATLDPGASCAVAVRFAPQSTGAKTATLRLRGPGGTTVAGLSGEGTAAANPVLETKAGTSRGRVALDLKLRPGSGTGKVTVGRARCASSEPCTIRLNGLVADRIGVRALPPSRLRIAPGKSAPITAALPPEFRKASPGTRLQISLHWKTGSERGATGKGFRLK